ncbi:hypothetical protein BKA57DRAFT_508734 [Linnemannia elongata]|nr:hypothetical protein BKA57DRAFT_508734 [Linnemannia elongata]
MDVESGSDPLTSVIFSPDGRVLFGVTKSGTVRQYDPVSGDHTERVNATAISADATGSPLATTTRQSDFGMLAQGYWTACWKAIPIQGPIWTTSFLITPTAIISKFTSSSSYLDHNGTGTVLGEEKGMMRFCYCLIVQKAYVYDAAEDTNESVGSVHPEARGTNGARTSCAT